MNTKPMPTMPKVTPMPAPPPRPNRNSEQVYAEEALRVAQRSLDQAAEIDRLGSELDGWRQRAQLAEAEIVRLEKRENDLQITLERERERLTDQRDAFRNRLNMLTSQFHTAGAIILKCLEAAEGSNGPQISLTKLAEELDKEQRQDEPLPHVVTAGPRENES